MEELKMKELKINELEEINGGWKADIKSGFVGWLVGKALDWAVESKPKAKGPFYNSTSRLL